MINTTAKSNGSSSSSEQSFALIHEFNAYLKLTVNRLIHKIETQNSKLYAGALFF
jgi:hypothetical protein